MQKSDGRRSRFWSVTLVFLLVVQLHSLVLGAQEESDLIMRIVILEGEWAKNSIRPRTAREPVVRVENEKGEPVAGAMVLFTLPDSGAGATFQDGSKTLIAYTDAKGRARARGLKPNEVAGDFQILVDATAKGSKTSTVINQSNVLTPPAGSGGVSGKMIAILAIAGGAVAAGVVAATGGNGNGSAPPPSPSATITAGSPTVGGPN
jgi:hypothetical protein